MSMRDLLELRGRVVAALRAIADTPEDAGDLSEDQSKRFDVLKGELATTEKRIERQALLDDVDRRSAGVPLTDTDDRFDAQCRGFSLTRAIAAQIDPRAVDAGREIEISQELSRRSGRSARGMLVPLGALVEKRVTTMEPFGSPAIGGAVGLLGTDHRPDLFVDALRPQAVVASLGARVLTGLRENWGIPRYGSGPAAEWVVENEPLTVQDYAFDQVTAEPHHVGLLAEWSRRVMLQASPEIEGLVRSDFTAKLALAVDLAALAGTGTGGEPLGITNSGAQTATGIADYEDVVNVVAMVESLDVPMTNLGWAGNAWAKARLSTTLRTSADTASNFIMPADNTLGGYPWRTTSQLGGGPGSPSAPATAIFGSWDKLIIAFWGDAGADVLVNPFETTAYRKGNVQIRAFVDCDIIVRYPEAFVVVSGIVIG